MKPDPETLATDAAGSIATEAFTDRSEGVFSKKYLSDRSVYEQLEEDEPIEFLLVNKRDGLEILDKDSSEPEDHNPTGGYHALAAVTPRRVFFAIGRPDGDETFTVNAADIDSVAFHSGWLSKTLIIETESAEYRFGVKKGDSSEVSHAVEYIRAELIPVTAPVRTVNGSDNGHMTPQRSSDVSESVGATMGESSTAPNQEETAHESESETDASAPDSTAEGVRLRGTSESEDDDGAGFSFGEIDAETAEMRDNERPNPPGPTRDELISDLQRLCQKLGRTPQPGDILRDSEFGIMAYTTEFGNWSNAIDAADAHITPDDDEVDEQSTDTEPSGEASKEQTGIEASGNERQTTASDDDAPPETTPSTSSGREFLIEEIERVSHELGRRPTLSDFETHTDFTTSDPYDYFESWDDAIAAANVEEPSRDELITELRRIESEIGYPPLANEVEDHSSYTPYEFRQEFGSIGTALTAAGLDVESIVKESIQKAVEGSSEDPKMSDFEDQSPYSSGIIYKYYDSWHDAVNEVKEAASLGDTEQSDSRSEGSKESNSPGTPEETQQESSTTPSSHESVGQNQVSELYELIRNLHVLTESVAEADWLSTEETATESDPMQTWAEEVKTFYRRGSENGRSYGALQRSKNEFSMSEYREKYGNGTRVTSFDCVPARQLTPTVRGLLSTLRDDDFSTFYVPVDEQSGAAFPIIVESEFELSQAREMLERLPADPTPSTNERTRTTGQAAEDKLSSESEESPDGTEPDVADKPTDGHQTPSRDQSSEGGLTEISGITDDIANALNASGFETRADLKTATMDEIAAVDGVSSQIAMRIKLNVGEE